MWTFQYLCVYIIVQVISIPVISLTWSCMCVIASGRCPGRLFQISRRAIALIVSIWPLKQTIVFLSTSPLLQSQIAHGLMHCYYVGLFFLFFSEQSDLQIRPTYITCLQWKINMLRKQRCIMCIAPHVWGNLCIMDCPVKRLALYIVDIKPMVN